MNPHLAVSSDARLTFQEPHPGEGEPRGRANEIVHAAARTLRAVASSVLLLVLPKCPLCIAVYLSGAGVSAAVAHGAAPLVRPLAFGLSLACWLLLLRGRWLQAKRRRCDARPMAPACCRAAVDLNPAGAERDRLKPNAIKTAVRRG